MLFLNEISKVYKKYSIDLIIYDNPNFLNTIKDVDEYFAKKKNYFQTDFYTWQRKSRNR